MTSTVFHAESSVRKWGGAVEDYLPIHNWFDETKMHFADCRHRALRHHSQGIFECERIFGEYITNSDGKRVPVRYLGEQHVREDCGGIIPTCGALPEQPCTQKGEYLPITHGRRDLLANPDPQKIGTSRSDKHE